MAIIDPLRTRRIPGFNPDDDNIFKAPQRAPGTGVAQGNLANTFNKQPAGSRVNDIRAKRALTKGAEGLATDTANPETRVAGTASAITALIVGLVGAGVSAGGAASSAKAQDEQLAAQRKQVGIQNEATARSQEEEERRGRLQGLETLADKRFRAQQSANMRQFSKSLINRIGQASSVGPQTSTLGGR